MSYHVLARKWRPQTFSELVGQEHVLRALINSLDSTRLHHAYLFTGTRGVGKTTIARILAKCLNCESGISSNPCNKCSSCNEIFDGRSVDVLEIDAASKTKVEDTRELLENVQYAPTRSTFKIYIIDEVHMLSGHSFNALLKTLEEPPPHVKFLLATTDPQKLPATVLSRCLQFCLKNMPDDQIVDYIRKIMESENIDYEIPALKLLAHAGAGSMRDSLSLVDQAISYGSGKLLASDVRAMLGTIDRERICSLLDAIGDDDIKTSLSLIENFSEFNPDYSSLLDEITLLLHAIAITQAVPSVDNSSKEHSEFISSMSKKLTSDDVQLYYQTAVNGKRDLPLAPDLRVGFEMIILRMIAFRPETIIDERLSKEDLVISETEKITSQDQSRSSDGVDLTTEEKNTDVTDLAEHSLAKPHNIDWNEELLQRLELSGITLSIASNCIPKKIDPGCIFLILDINHSKLFKKRHLEKIQSAVQIHLGKEFSVQIEIGLPPSETPAQRKIRLEADRQLEAEIVVDGDGDLKNLIDRFDGVLDRDSIRPLKRNEGAF